MKRRTRSKKQGPVKSKKVVHDGITFASGLEKYMYCALKKAGIQAEYEGESYNLLEPFHLPNECYERWGKSEITERGQRKIHGMRYTPDFIANDFVIECKGRANDAFPLRWKLFKKYVADNLPGVTLYKPQKQSECDRVVELILEKRNA